MRVYPPPGQQTRWVEAKDGRYAAFADVHLVAGDSLETELAYGCKGEADEKAREKLIATSWQFPKDPCFFVGQLCCFAGRVSDSTAAEVEAERALPPQTAYTVLLRQAVLPVGQSFVGWLFDRPGFPDQIAFFHQDDEAERRTATFFHDVLPRLGPPFYKILHQYERGYEEALQHTLAEKEAALAMVLDGILPSRDVEALDERLKSLAAAYHDFAEELATLKALAQGGRVLNLRESYAQHSLPREGPLGAWLGLAELALAQLEVDAGSY